MRYPTRATIAGLLGNLIENFDLAICGLLSGYLAKYLIGDTQKGLLIVFATFFVGSIARPIGAVVLGLFSDAYGRKITLATSILSMGIATTFIGFIPSHSSIGFGAIVILFILRIIQSFSCGSEYLNSSTYLIENAAPSKKGYAGSWAAFGAMAGLLIASVLMLMVSHFSHRYPHLDWLFWRVPFILALLGSSIGLYIRLFIPESIEYVKYYAAHPKPTFQELLSQSFQYMKESKLKCLYGFVLSCIGVTTTVQIYIYGPTQAHMYGNISDQQMIVSNIISLSVMLMVFPFFGKLSDLMNREKIVIGASIGFLFLYQPYFYFLSNGNYPALILIQSLIAIPAAAYYATVPAMLASMFPLNLRCTILSVLYSTAASLSAGLCPVLSLSLIARTQQSTSPSLLPIILLILVLMIMKVKTLKESSFKARGLETNPL